MSVERNLLEKMENWSKKLDQHKTTQLEERDISLDIQECIALLKSCRNHLEGLRLIEEGKAKLGLVSRCPIGQICNSIGDTP